MKKLLISLILLIAEVCSAQTITTDFYRSKYGSGSGGWIVSYAVHLPEGYNPLDKTKKWPLIIVLHGNGEKKWNYNDPKGAEILRSTYMCGAIYANKLKVPAIVVQPRSPFCGWDEPVLPNGTCPESPASVVYEVADTMLARYNVDKYSMHLTGGSDGGKSVFWALCDPKKSVFASYVPIAGWFPEWPNSNIAKTNPEWKKYKSDSIAAKKAVGIWVIHNTNDGVVRYGGNPPFINKINSWNPVEKAEGCFDGQCLSGCHDAWYPTYSLKHPCTVGKNIYDWMLSHRLKGAPVDTIKPAPVDTITFNGTGAPTYFTGFVVETKSDSINYQWKFSPVEKIPADYFKTTIAGFIKAPLDGEFTFYFTSDDQVEVAIDRELLLKDTLAHAARTFSFKKTLKKGQKYSLEVFHTDQTSWAVLKGEWEANGFKRRTIAIPYLSAK